jgi:hypothetical protein
MDDARIFTGQELQKKSDSQPILAAPTGIEQSRAVAEAIASIQVAKQFPRSVSVSWTKIIQECKRKSLAEKAEYIYPRGNKTVRGATIRLMEVIARNWGNIESGFDEIKKDAGTSEVRAFCWDVETNTKAVKKFHVKHWRDTKKGGYAVEGERDTYELVANMAMRRVRACIENIIPGDIVEAALEQCRQTLSKGEHGETHEDRVRKMTLFFKEKGVNANMLKAYLGHEIDDTTKDEIVDLFAIANAIKENPTLKDSFFKKADKPKSKKLKEQPKTKISPKKKTKTIDKTIEEMTEIADNLINEAMPPTIELVELIRDLPPEAVEEVCAPFNVDPLVMSDEEIMELPDAEAQNIFNALKAQKEVNGKQKEIL